MAERALALPTILVLNELKHLPANSPEDVSRETLSAMGVSMTKEVHRLNSRSRRLFELADFFEDASNPSFEDFREALKVFFHFKAPEDVEPYFVYSYNRYIKEPDEPWVDYVDETLFNIVQAKGDEYADMAEDVALIIPAATTELNLLIRMEELWRDKVTRGVFFDEVKKFGIDLRTMVDE